MSESITADGSEARADIQQGRESLGKAIMSQVTGEDAFPEEVTFDMRLFDNGPRIFHQIHCALEIFPQEQQFAITPFPEQIRSALDGEIAAMVSEFGDYVDAFAGECP